MKALALVAAVWAFGAAAQPWPSKPLQIWHGFAPGANPDIIARTLQPALAERLGQPVVIDTKPGAGGRIATAFVAKQPADGHALIMLTGGDGVMAATVTDLPYDLLRDFAFVSTTTVFRFLVLVSAESPYQSLGQLIEDARKRPGKLSYGHSGIASTLHLAGELLKEQTGIDMVHVPYKGTQVQELAAGRLDMAIQVATSAMPWLGLAAPSRTSQAIVDRLSDEVRTLLAREDIAARIRATGAEPRAMTSAEFRARVEADILKWRRLAAKINLN
jgi:tripartite-type tricarboxylate transporter receptor subunit TctC